MGTVVSTDGGADASTGDAAPADTGATDDAAFDATTSDAPGSDASTSDASGSDATVGDAADAGRAIGQPVLQFHNHPSRDGVYVDPLITAAAAARMHMDPTFSATLDGNVYGQPLYVTNGPGGAPALFVATENNSVYALDTNGSPLWIHSVGAPAGRADSCGAIQPLGITGTPAVDMTRRAIYLDAARPGTTTTNMREHEIHALSLDNGQELPGWPVKASTVSGTIGPDAGTMRFVPNPQNQRGALLIAGDVLYVPYGGHSGDCPDSDGTIYHGWVIGVPLDNPSGATGVVTLADQSGIWSLGGLSSDGTNLFATTGNANKGQSCPNPAPTSPPPGWGQQEAILRFQPGPVWSGRTSDYWAPVDWACLDNVDDDIGGSSPVLVDLPSGSPQHLVIANGKDGIMYFVDRTNLGGVGTPPQELMIMAGSIMMAPVVYTTPSGTYVVTYGAESMAEGCPPNQSGNLIAIKISPGSPPAPTGAWCADEQGQGSPIFTTSDGTNDNLVWAIGAESSNRLRAWNADTGAVVFDGGGSGDVATGINHLCTPIAAAGRIFVAASGKLYAYTSK